jgi:hypothetical protein
MRRLAWLLLVVALAFGTVGFTPADAPLSLASPNAPVFSIPPPMALSIPGDNANCTNIRATRICVSVSDARPAPGSRLTIYGMLKTRGVGQSGKNMKAMWRSKGTVSCTAVTDESGIGRCSATFSGAGKGQKVRIKVTIGKFTLSTYVTSR